MRAFLLLALLLGSALGSYGRALLNGEANSQPETLPTVTVPDSALPGGNDTESSEADDAGGVPSALLSATVVPGEWSDVPDMPAVTDPDSGVLNNVQTRIINGEVDTRSIFPYASLIAWDLGSGIATCTGSLVAPGYVLTAAHCFEEGGRRALPREVRVWIYGTWHTAAGIMVHEGFRNLEGSTTEPSNDVAMVALAQLSSVPPVRLPRWRQPLAGMQVFAAGFGITESGRNSEQLRYTGLTVFGSGQCPPRFKGTCPSGFADNFVAGGYAGYTCNGDSGGPITRATPTGDVLVGLTSFGDINCLVPYAYYVRIYDHRKKIALWLQSRVNSPQPGLHQAARNWIQDVPSKP